MKNSTNLNKAIKDLQQAILKIDGEKYPKLKDWNINYFEAQKNRYIDSLETIKRLNEGAIILEIGALPCHMTFLLGKMGFEVIGVDIDPTRCQSFIKEHQLAIKACDIEKESLPFEAGQFSLILFNEVFEHLRINPIATLRDINRVLSEEGLLILSTPNLYSLRNIVRFFIGRGTVDPFEEFSKLENVGHMGHIREYSKREVKKFLENTGFTVKVHEFKTYASSQRFLIGPFINLIHRVFSKIRPFQVFICQKINSG